MEVKVHNMKNSKGNSVDQFIIETEKGAYFQSGKSIIAFRPKEGLIQLDKNVWNCSSTTGKYRNKFLGENIKETKKKIAIGEYILTELNE